MSCTPLQNNTVQCVNVCVCVRVCIKLKISCNSLKCSCDFVHVCEYCECVIVLSVSPDVL